MIMPGVRIVFPIRMAGFFGFMAMCRVVIVFAMRFVVMVAISVRIHRTVCFQSLESGKRKATFGFVCT
jgi:hypothetical protein